MNFYHAQLTEDNVCISIVNLDYIQSDNNLLYIGEKENSSYLNQKYENGTWRPLTEEEELIFQQKQLQNAFSVNENITYEELETQKMEVTQITQLDRIEIMLHELKNNITSQTIDEYTIELINQGIL